MGGGHCHRQWRVQGGEGGRGLCCRQQAHCWLPARAQQVTLCGSQARLRAARQPVCEHRRQLQSSLQRLATCACGATGQDKAIPWGSNEELITGGVLAEARAEAKADAKPLPAEAEEEAAAGQGGGGRRGARIGAPRGGHQPQRLLPLACLLPFPPSTAPKTCRPRSVPACHSLARSLAAVGPGLRDGGGGSRGDGRVARRSGEGDGLGGGLRVLADGLGQPLQPGEGVGLGGGVLERLGRRGGRDRLKRVPSGHNSGQAGPAAAAHCKGLRPVLACDRFYETKASSFQARKLSPHPTVKACSTSPPLAHRSERLQDARRGLRLRHHLHQLLLLAGSDGSGDRGGRSGGACRPGRGDTGVTHSQATGCLLAA